MTNIGIALEIMGMGMLGIFTAITVIIGAILLLHQAEKILVRKK